MIVRKKLEDRHVVVKIIEIDLSEFVGGLNGSILQCHTIKFPEITTATADADAEEKVERDLLLVIECTLAPQLVAVLGPEYDKDDMDSLSTTSEIECAEVDERARCYVNDENDNRNGNDSIRMCLLNYHHSPKAVTDPNDTQRGTKEPGIVEDTTVTEEATADNAAVFEQKASDDINIIETTSSPSKKKKKKKKSSKSLPLQEHELSSIEPISTMVSTGEGFLQKYNAGGTPLRVVNKEGLMLVEGRGGQLLAPPVPKKAPISASSLIIDQVVSDDHINETSEKDQGSKEEEVDGSVKDKDVIAETSSYDTKPSDVMITYDSHIPEDIYLVMRSKCEAYEAQLNEQKELISKHEFTIETMKDEHNQLKSRIDVKKEKGTTPFTDSSTTQEGNENDRDIKIAEYEKQIETLQGKLDSAEEFIKNANTDTIMKVHAVEIKLQKKLVEKENEMKEEKKQSSQVLSQAITLRDKELAIVKNQVIELESEREEVKREFDEAHMKLKQKLIITEENIKKISTEKHLLEITGADYARRLAEADSKLSRLSFESQQHAEAGLGVALRLQEAEKNTARIEKEKESLLYDLEVARTNYAELSASAAATDAEKALGPVSPDRLNRSSSLGSNSDDDLEVTILRQQNGTLKSELYTTTRELDTTKTDLAILEKAMDMNHSNLFVGANSNSCIGLAEMREGEIKLLKAKNTELESELEFYKEQKFKIEMESAKKVKDAERRTQALFSTLGNSDSSDLIHSLSSSLDLGSVPLVKEVYDLEQKVEELNKTNETLQEKLNFQLSMVNSLSQEVIEAGLENTDQRIEIKDKGAKIHELANQLESLKEQMEKNTGAPMTELDETVHELIQSKMIIAQLNISVDDLRLQNAKLLQQQQTTLNFTSPRRVKKGSFLASFSNNNIVGGGDEIMCMNCTNCSIVGSEEAGSIVNSNRTSFQQFSSYGNGNNVGDNNPAAGYDDVA